MISPLSLFKKKRGSWIVDSLPFYLVFAIVVWMLFLLFAFIVNSSASGKHAIPPGLEEFLLEQRFFSSSCFGTRDAFTDGQLPLIGQELFNPPQLTRCYQASGKGFPAYRLTLTAGDGEKTVLTLGYDETRGASRGRSSPVRVLAGDSVTDGTLRIEVQHV